jgi:pSer/pThr/pTyr-binding forkhead associated (FHA) protein
MSLTLNLTFMSGSRDGEVVELAASGSPPSISIGRSAPCELVITDDPELSRRHAHILWSGTSWMLEDLNSSNGVIVGEFQTARRLAGTHTFKEGDIFRVGLTRLRFSSTRNDRNAMTGAATAIK